MVIASRSSRAHYPNSGGHKHPHDLPIMAFFEPFALIFNSFTLALAIAFLFIVLWYDVRRTVNQFFALYLILVQIWNVGFLLEQVSRFIDDDRFLVFATGLAEAGFVSSSIGLYSVMAVLVGVQPRRFRLIIGLYLTIALGYVGYLYSTGQATPQTLSFVTFFFIVFDGLTIYLMWRYRRKLRNSWAMIGILGFVAGQVISYANPNLGLDAASATISSVGVLIISAALIQQQIIVPLFERGAQLEAMHEVSIAITSRIATDAVLNEIAERAAEWLQADGACIFLMQDGCLRLVAIYNMPLSVMNMEVEPGYGVSGSVAQTKETIFLENFARDWTEEIEFPLAQETFGSLIGVPLVYDEDVIGTLLVISGAQGHLFDRDDVDLLELLAAQAAVAITHGKLFNEQKVLADRLEVAHDQLHTVLTSTNNPVIAVNRSLQLVFTNPAAISLFALDTIHRRDNLTRALPSHVVPRDFRAVLRQIRTEGVYNYEIEWRGKTYLCHVASLGETRIEGFVAVLNDVTELKELDRIKSEMVRMTSHDLKNPLQAAMANLELLRDDVEAFKDQEVSLSIDNIERQLNKMERIIRAILDLERIRMGANAADLCHPAEIIEDAVAELRDMAQEQHVTLTVQVAPDVRNFLGDAEQFERAIINLVENAIKFNHAGGEVQIAAKNDGNSIMITVRDNGIGIPYEVQSKIFDRFFRGHQQGAEHISGSGLGLSLVKAVIDNHGGQIWLESASRVGTTFSMRIPVATNAISVVSE